MKNLALIFIFLCTIIVLYSQPEQIVRQAFSANNSFYTAIPATSLTSDKTDFINLSANFEILPESIKIYCVIKDQARGINPNGFFKNTLYNFTRNNPPGNNSNPVVIRD